MCYRRFPTFRTPDGFFSLDANLFCTIFLHFPFYFRILQSFPSRILAYFHFYLRYMLSTHFGHVPPCLAVVFRFSLPFSLLLSNTDYCLFHLYIPSPASSLFMLLIAFFHAHCFTFMCFGSVSPRNIANPPHITSHQRSPESFRGFVRPRLRITNGIPNF